MKAMILAAGRGERMGSLTDNMPKPLVKVNGLRLIEYNLNMISRAGISDVVINICWHGDQIIDQIGNGKEYGLNIIYIDEKDKMLGTGGGILNALPILGESPFWLINSDIFTDYEININKTLDANKLGHLILVPNPKHNSDGDFFLEDNSIKYKDKNRPYTYSGMSILSSKLFKECHQEIFPLEPLLESAASLDLLSGEFFDGFWLDIGTVERKKELEAILKIKT